MAERLELAQVISQLRQELSAAMREGKVSSQASQRITLTLDPRRRGIVGKPLISGPEWAGERESPLCE